MLNHDIEIDHSSTWQTFEIEKCINTARIYKTPRVEQIVFFLQAQYKYHKFPADLGVFFKNFILQIFRQIASVKMSCDW